MPFQACKFLTQTSVLPGNCPEWSLSIWKTHRSSSLNANPGEWLYPSSVNCQGSGGVQVGQAPELAALVLISYVSVHSVLATFSIPHLSLKREGLVCPFWGWGNRFSHVNWLSCYEKDWTAFSPKPTSFPNLCFRLPLQAEWVRQPVTFSSLTSCVTLGYFLQLSLSYISSLIKIDT
jgi:hypothetical protein